ncbi:hypothetical protein PTRA_a0651 [Pseudoalteromonas translucida KMM 520]|uniref:Uncharacterized protein n=1 Tax=Pseudoalteromonas translucida KMM 520 TaxID=1315283 RepID=A0A0U2VBF5_9GAMM|nr:hypothetical protein PTRA_a0651 [Pseudoalteromonas translucida KMM 520]
MLRGANTKIKTKSLKNNFALAVHPLSNQFGSIGGKMEAMLKVDHVALRATDPSKNAAYSVVAGQIHAGKVQALIDTKLGYSWGNEPLKYIIKSGLDIKRDRFFGTTSVTYQKQILTVLI